MTQAVHAGGTLGSVTVAEKYDVFGQRVEEDVTQGSTTVTKFALDAAGNAWADLGSTNALVMRRLYLDGPNQAYARITAGGTPSWYDTDHLGSVRVLTDNSTGAASDVIDYDAYGNVVTQTQPANGDREGYAGLQSQVTLGLNYADARWYNPATGRWTTEDPSGFDAGDPNLDRYVGNSPTNATDPRGQQDTRYTMWRNRVDAKPTIEPAPPPAPGKSAPSVTVDPRDDYKGVPREVHDFFSIAFDVLLSGHPKKEVRNRAAKLIGGPLGPDTVYDEMERYCKKTYGEGWKPVPIEFRLTGVQFYPTAASGEGLAGPPRTETVKIPVVIQRKGAKEPELKVYKTTRKVPLAHFYIDGYWVFKCTNGKRESPKYGIALEGKAHTWVHAPYDAAFAGDVARIRGELNEDETVQWAYFGRSYDRLAIGMDKGSLLAINALRPYFKVSLGDKGKDLKILKGFVFPK